MHHITHKPSSKSSLDCQVLRMSYVVWLADATDLCYLDFFVLFLLLQPSFVQHYVQIASRKLLLFHGRRSLDVNGRRQRWCQQGGADSSSSSSSSDLVIRLSDLVNSPVMAELQELLMLGPGAEQERDLYSNWFSLQVRSQWLFAVNTCSKCRVLVCCCFACDMLCLRRTMVQCSGCLSAQHLCRGSACHQGL